MSNPSWNHTLLRAKDADTSAAFYQKHFGFEVVAREETAETVVVYIATLPKGEAPPATVTRTAHVLLAFRSEKADAANDAFKANSGNVQPHRGFGHVAVFVEDVYKKCAELEAAGVGFQKKPDDGNMKGLAFALDADGYWIEIIRGQGYGSTLTTPANLSQTMIRVRDAQESLAFYTGALGLTTVAEKHFPQWKFSLYFLAAGAPAGAPADPKSEAAFEFMKTLHEPILELTHNHDSDEVYHSGHDDKPELRGFSRLGFLVDSVAAPLPAALGAPVPADQLPADLPVEANSVYVRDPTGYYVQLRARE